MDKVNNSIVFRNVTKRYNEHIAINNINLSFPSGKLTILIGPSGSGKTTTLKLINRLIEPTSGNIFIKGENIKNIKPHILRRKIGYVIQNIGLFNHMSVAKNISIVPGLLKWDKSKIRKRVIELLELVNLDPDMFFNKMPSELSGGEAQRIGVARALAADPDIMIMDEPFGALDPITRNKLQNQFLKIQEKLKKTIVFVTHDIDEAIKLGDYIAIFCNGKVQQFDKTENILKYPANKFVSKFIGSDKALKKLVRINVKPYIVIPIMFILKENIIKNIIIPESFSHFSNKNLKDYFEKDYYEFLNYIWVIDENKNLKGYLNLKQSSLNIFKSDSKFQTKQFKNKNHIFYNNYFKKLFSGKKISEFEALFTEFDQLDLESFIFVSDTLKDALSKLINNDSQYLPVLDEKSKFSGLISLNKIFKILHEW